jgi:hypothetical protein
MMKIVNNVITAAGSYAASGVIQDLWQATATSVYNRCLMFDITRGAPNYTVKVFYPDSNAAVSLTTRTTFLSQLEATTPTLLYHANGSDRTVAVNEATDGVLDHVNIWWNRSAPAVSIDDVSIVRLL